MVLCAAAPGQARTISGSVRDDSGKPVAAKILVTWTPAGGGSFSLESTSTKTISAGEFSYYVDVGALADLYWEDPRHTFKL